MTIRNLAEAGTALSSYMSPTAKLADRDLKLARVLKLLEALDNPHEKLRAVHIAGTSGKTSTAYYVAALLKAAGKKVGLTVSPHVDGLNERVQINGEPLSASEFCSDLGKFLDIVHATGKKESASYFELLYAFAFWEFARQDVDYAVLETGLGGLYDASNVAQRSDKVCVITDIGFDHMHILGDTLAKISEQKAGIIHKHNHVFMYKQSAEIMRPIHARVKIQEASLHLLDENDGRQAQNNRLSDMPAYQQRNWSLAHGVYAYLERRDGLEHLSDQVLRDTQAIRLPGRMEVIKTGGKTVVMDGAHNVQKMTALIDSFKKLYPGINPAVLLSVKDNKDYESIVPLLAPFASRVIVTKFETMQDFKVESMDPETLAEAFRAAGSKDVIAIADQDKAYQALLVSPEPVLLITGSFYLLSQLRNDEGLA